MIIFSFWSRALCWLVILFLLNIHLHFLIKNLWRVSGIGPACGHCIEVRSSTLYLERIWVDFIKPTENLLNKSFVSCQGTISSYIACGFYLDSLHLFSSWLSCSHVTMFIVNSGWTKCMRRGQISDRYKQARKASDILKCHGNKCIHGSHGNYNNE